MCGEVNWGREKPWKEESCLCLQREDRNGGEGRYYRKSTLPKSSWRESGKVEKTAGIELKREKKKGEGLSSIKTL